VEERKQLLQEALKSYSMALALNPLNSDLFIGQARAFELIGQREEALKSCERAVQVDPNNAYLYADLGKVYRDMGETARALEAFKRCNELKWTLMAWMNLEELKNPEK
jgi:tetratricopeptide (TPR) repeat protein